MSSLVQTALFVCIHFSQIENCVFPLCFPPDAAVSSAVYRYPANRNSYPCAVHRDNGKIKRKKRGFLWITMYL